MHPSNKITPENAAEVSRHHVPTPAQAGRLQRIAEARETFLYVILENAPDCADRSTALRDARSAGMWASSAIVLEERIPGDER